MTDDYKSSMADLADVGAELFDRVQQIATDVIPDGTWSDQPQHVRDAICILFAMVRNRTAPAFTCFGDGRPFDVGTSDDIAIAWVGTATGEVASENLDEKLRAAFEKHPEGWRPVAVAIENGRMRDITSEVIGPTAEQLEAALRYVWYAWSEAEGSGQPRGWVFGPGAELDAHMAECGETPRPRASLEIQETIRRAIGERDQQEPPWQCLTCGRSRAEVAGCTAGDFCPLKRRSARP